MAIYVQAIKLKRLYFWQIHVADLQNGKPGISAWNLGIIKDPAPSTKQERKNVNIFFSKKTL